ncbi:MAG: hypothetical protein JWP13_176 [Candidatus Saccharibacteria bacterium]|nr:hypothetical protein [Candidatus Saccharibacteria bacterium]
MTNIYVPVEAEIRSKYVWECRDREYDPDRVRLIGATLGKVALVLDDLAGITSEVKADCAVAEATHTVQGEFVDYLDDKDPAPRPLIRRLTLEYGVTEQSHASGERYRLNLGYGTSPGDIMFSNDYVIGIHPEGESHLRVVDSNDNIIRTLQSQAPHQRRLIRFKKATAYDATHLLSELQHLQRLKTAVDGW